MIRTILINVLICVSVVCEVYAIHPRTRNFAKSQYHAGTQNWSIDQNRARVLYFANNAGLLEFDGRRWELHPIPNGTALRSVCYVADEERIYVGSYNEAGYFTLDDTGRFRYTSLRGGFGQQDLGEIWDIRRVDGTFYFRGDRHVVMQHGDRIHVFGFADRIACSAAVNGSYFVCTPSVGMQLLSGEMFITIPGSELLVGKNVCAMLPHIDGGLLVITDSNGFFHYDGVRIVRLPTRLDDYLKGKRIISAASNDRFLALGTVKDGLLIYDRRDGAVIRHDRRTGMQNNTVLSLAFDMDGNLWAGLDNGLDCILLNLPEYRLFGTEESYGAGYASLIDNGMLYLGTAQGLYLCRDPGTLRQTPHLEEVAGMQGQVWSLAAIGGTVFCAHDLGLFEISGAGSRRIHGVEGVWKVTPVIDRDDLVMGCSYSGLFILRKQNGVWRFSHRIAGFDESSRIFEQDADGSVWFSHWIKGLFRLTFDRDYAEVTHSAYYGVNRGLPTERNNIPFRIGNGLVFSSEGGFLRHDSTRDTMLHVTAIDSLFISPPVSMRVHQSPENDLLFVSGDSFCAAIRQPDGSYMIDSLGLRFLADELIIGFEDLDFLGGRRMLLGNEKGFSIVDYGNLRHHDTLSVPHSVIIKSVYQTNRGGSPVYGERSERSERPDRPRVTLPHRDNSLRFGFVSPEYRSDDAIEYSCMLEGFDREWSPFSPAGSKEYTGLAGGDYVFRVRSRNLYAPQTAQTSFPFTVLPAWYAGKMATVAYVLLGLGAIWLTMVYFRRRSRSQVLLVEQRKEEEIRAQRKRYEDAAWERENELVLHKNRALEYELRNKSQELASSTMNLIRKNEILLKIRDELAKLGGQDSGHRTDARVKRIQQYIRENIGHDQDWSKFQSNFDLVYENYLKRLTESYPQLNMNDRKLCAYLRMNLHTKEIAPLMNITVRGVEMARYRLRRKLGLSRDSNLSEYLQRF